MGSIGVMWALFLVMCVIASASASQTFLYATFRGESSSPINNVIAFDATGAIAVKGVLAAVPSSETLSELRSMTLDAQDVLWVCNSHKSHSAVYRFGPPSAIGVRPYLQTWASLSSANPGLIHPYKVFLSGSSVYVSTQDSAEVLRFSIDGALLPVSDYLSSSFPTANFDPGAFVGPQTIVPASQGGLNSPRGLTVSGNGSLLLVADNGGLAVRVYDIATGDYLEDLYTSTTNVPVALLMMADGKTVLVSLEVADQVVSIDLDSRAVMTVLDGLDSPAGMAIGCDGALYVANRKAKVIVRSILGSGTWEPFSQTLTDEPEQLLALSC